MTVASLLCALAGSTLSSFAEPVVGEFDPKAETAKFLRETKGIADIRTIHRSALGADGLDVVVVSAGFTEKEKDYFIELCTKTKDSFFSLPPWNRYQDWVNFHAVFVADESMENSRLKVVGYDGKLLVSDNQIATEYASYAANPDGVVVLHNSSFSTATCGTWGVSTINKTSAGNAGALVHELGHGIAGLGDEYIQREGPFNEPPESLDNTVNVTAIANPRLCKWHYWTVDEWPGIFRPMKGTGSIVGNFEGAGWPTKIYRPEKSCMMRGDRSSFCVVCNETMEAAFFRHSEMFTTVEPFLEQHVLWKGESLDFKVKTTDLIANPPAWITSRLELFLDGRTVASSDSGEVTFHFDGKKAKPGVYQLGARLDIQSDTIRRDFGFLTESQAWQVKVMSQARPRFELLKPRLSIASNETVNAPVKLKQSGSARFDIRMEHAPPDAVLDGGFLKWKPNGKTGSWRIDFIASHEGVDAATESLEIHVHSENHSDGKISIDPPKVIDAVMNTKLVTRVGGNGSSVGNLLFQSDKLPSGAVLDRYTGELSWTPESKQMGMHALKFRVNSGKSTEEFNVVFRVRGAAKPTPVSYFNQYVPETLERLKKLQQDPLVHRRIFETLRLLRDRYPKIWEPALAEAEKMYAEFDENYQNLCIEHLNRYAWSLSDKPAVFAWMQKIASDKKTESKRNLANTLSVIAEVESIKKIEIEGGASDLKRAATLMIQSHHPFIRAAYERVVVAICNRITDKQGCQRALLSVLETERGPGRAKLIRLLPRDPSSELTNGLKSLAADKDPDTAAAAKQTLEYFTGLATTGDFITQWMISGPYSAREGKSLFDDAFDPELKDGKVEWKVLELKPNTNGSYIADLGGLMSGENCAAYMKTVIHSALEQDVTFAAGSDDGIKVWLNGELIHAKNMRRPVNPGEDRFIGKLKKGNNHLLCKIVQYTSDWGACMQLRAADGGGAIGVKISPAIATGE